MKPSLRNNKNVWKRGLDLSLVALSAPFWMPLFGIFSIWIKSVSKGPVFFRQNRIGYRQKPFEIFKFRTMHTGADTSGHQKYVANLIEGGAEMKKLDGNDPRLIPGAKLIRSTGLDELPQIFNVIRGEMSLVGPRPCTPEELAVYPENCKKRLNGLPGMTGSWQVNGKNLTTFKRMIALDILYLKKSSLFLDLGIILYTLPAMLEQMGLFKRKATIKLKSRQGNVRNAH